MLHLTCKGGCAYGFPPAHVYLNIVDKPYSRGRIPVHSRGNFLNGVDNIITTIVVGRDQVSHDITGNVDANVLILDEEFGRLAALRIARLEILSVSLSFMPADLVGFIDRF